MTIYSLDLLINTALIPRIKWFKNNNFKGYFPLTVITKYWLYSSCCTVDPWAYLIPDHLDLPLSHPYIVLPQLITTKLFSRSVSLLLFVIFTSLQYFLDSTYRWYLIVFIFLCLTYFTWHNALLVHQVAAGGKTWGFLGGWVGFHCILV